MLLHMNVKPFINSYIELERSPNLFLISTKWYRRRTFFPPGVHRKEKTTTSFLHIFTFAPSTLFSFLSHTSSNNWHNCTHHLAKNYIRSIHFWRLCIINDFINEAALKCKCDINKMMFFSLALPRPGNSRRTLFNAMTTSFENGSFNASAVINIRQMSLEYRSQQIW